MSIMTTDRLRDALATGAIPVLEYDEADIERICTALCDGMVEPVNLRAMEYLQLVDWLMCRIEDKDKMLTAMAAAMGESDG